MLHRRTWIVARHKNKINEAILGVVTGIDLTSVEVSMVLQELALHWAQYAVKDERDFEAALEKAGVDATKIWEERKT